MVPTLVGEPSRGTTVHVPLSADGQIALYIWPLRLLQMQGTVVAVPLSASKSARKKSGASTVMTPPPAIGREVATIAWQHRASPRDVPAHIQRVAEQVEWAFAHVQHHRNAFLEDAQDGDAAARLAPALVQTARTLCASPLRSTAICRRTP
jgi:hypothetical protein